VWTRRRACRHRKDQRTFSSDDVRLPDGVPCFGVVLHPYPHTHNPASLPTLAFSPSFPFSPPHQAKADAHSPLQDAPRQKARRAKSSHAASSIVVLGPSYNTPKKWPRPLCLPSTRRTATARPRQNPPHAPAFNRPAVNHVLCLPSLPSSIMTLPQGGGGPATPPPWAIVCAPPSSQRSRT